MTSAADVSKLLARVPGDVPPPAVALDGAALTLTYPTAAAYAARTSADAAAVAKAARVRAVEVPPPVATPGHATCPADWAGPTRVVFTLAD